MHNEIHLQAGMPVPQLHLMILTNLLHDKHRWHN